MSALALVLVASLALRLPLPAWNLLQMQSPKVVLGGRMGAVIVAGLAAAASRLGPTQTILSYFGAITLISVVVDHFGLFGTAAKPMGMRQVIGFAAAAAGLFLARS